MGIIIVSSSRTLTPAEVRSPDVIHCTGAGITITLPDMNDGLGTIYGNVTIRNKSGGSQTVAFNHKGLTGCSRSVPVGTGRRNFAAVKGKDETKWFPGRPRSIRSDESQHEIQNPLPYTITVGESVVAPTERITTSEAVPVLFIEFISFAQRGKSKLLIPPVIKETSRSIGYDQKPVILDPAEFGPGGSGIIDPTTRDLTLSDLVDFGPAKCFENDIGVEMVKPDGQIENVAILKPSNEFGARGTVTPNVKEWLIPILPGSGGGLVIGDKVNLKYSTVGIDGTRWDLYSNESPQHPEIKETYGTHEYTVHPSYIPGTGWLDDLPSPIPADEVYLTQPDGSGGTIHRKIFPSVEIDTTGNGILNKTKWLIPASAGTVTFGSEIKFRGLFNGPDGSTWTLTEGNAP